MTALTHGSPLAPRLFDDAAGGDATALRRLYRLAPDGEDVQPWVLDALPVLLHADPPRAEVVRLVGDLAGADRTWQMNGVTARAKHLLAADGRLTALLSDDDPGVREAAAYAVRAVYRLLPDLPQLLWDRFAAEPDARVRLTLLRSCVISGVHGTGYEATKAGLAAVADTDPDLRVRITALTEFMALHHSSPQPPAFDAGKARDTLLAAYRDGLNREPAPVDEVTAPLRAGARMATRQWTPGYHPVVTAVRAGYRDDAGAQLSLLHDMLDIDAWDAWQDALYEARSVVQRLRGPYTPLVDRAAALLGGPDPVVRTAAMRLLLGIGEVGRPAADAVHAVLPDPKRWVVRGEIAPAIEILAILRDERVLPILERLLDEAPDARDLHQHIAGYGIRARRLGFTLRRRLRATSSPGPLPAGSPPAGLPAGSSSAGSSQAGLLEALVAVAPQEAADHLAGVPIDVAGLELLARAGRTAAARIPEIHTALDSTDAVLALAAARAIWLVSGDSNAAVTVYDRYFEDPAHAVAAIDGLAALGIRAAGHATRLTKRLTGRSGNEVRAAAACALWRVVGNPSGARMLGRVWEESPRIRPRIARLWVEIGNAGYAVRHAESELAIPVRHNASNLGLSPSEINVDEQLLADCRQVIAQNRTEPRPPRRFF
ncbi:HEAT repeat domain-containing protein [Actinoplanes sp. DH11]|uniref:HEAT repeat domain-containing protein n=1 Tax=Actinoplanes sp. DH11 TaxID=2857011 RepID=UPI001E4B2419|nr:HEAT repeat domain-containing protein [Actinoplanes sp. DH11]